ncbi:MAG: tetratricopeptide repeat protein [Firmicutes bacterium]|nr:tetratricopeptide repeat protein [Bacillota bacterium]
MKFLLPFGLVATALAQAPAEDPRALMLQGRAQQRRGGGDDPQAAAALYRRALALVPTSAEAHLRLSEALADFDDLEGALPPAIRATELAPANAEAWAHLGILNYLRARKQPTPQLQAKAQEQAQAALKKAALLMPGDVEIWTRLAEVAEIRKDNEAALKAWLRVGRLHPPFMIQDKRLEEIAWTRVAQLASERKDYDVRREAVLSLCRGSRPDPYHLRLLEDLAREQVEKGFLGHAEESFALLGRHLPKEPAVWDNLALIQIRTVRFEEALESLKKAQELRPTPRGEFNRGLCLINLGRIEESEACWRTVLNAPALSRAEEQLVDNARSLLATSLLLRGLPKEGLALLRTWPQTSAKPPLLGLEAQALIQTQAWKEARRVLRDGMKRFPDFGIFQLANTLPPDRLEDTFFLRATARQAMTQLDLEVMAGLYAEFRRWDRCLETIHLARMAAPPRDVELLLLQANALQELGLTEEAKSVLREGQRMNPNHPILQNNLGYLLLERDPANLSEASALIQSAYDQNPSNPSVVDSWGWALFKLGRFKEAEAMLRKASELAPFSPEARRHWGEALIAVGRPQEALEQWERALAYAFPERKALEIKARELRASLAKQRKEPTPGPEAAPEPAPEPDEETP